MNFGSVAAYAYVLLIHQLPRKLTQAPAGGGHACMTRSFRVRTQGSLTRSSKPPQNPAAAPAGMLEHVGCAAAAWRHLSGHLQGGMACKANQAMLSPMPASCRQRPPAVAYVHTKHGRGCTSCCTRPSGGCQACARDLAVAESNFDGGMCTSSPQTPPNPEY